MGPQPDASLPRAMGGVLIIGLLLFVGWLRTTEAYKRRDYVDLFFMVVSIAGGTGLAVTIALALYRSLSS